VYNNEDSNVLDWEVLKRVELAEYDSKGDPTLLVINPANAPIEKLAFHSGPKVSYHPEIQAFVSQVSSDPKYLYVFVNALGAGEYYGPNLNGDYFPEKEILRSDNYGYRTYMNCGVYRNHVNGRRGGVPFGNVVVAVYNPVMRRVELILRIDRELAAKQGHADLIEMLDCGKRPHVSMGILVPYDICSLKKCPHKVPDKKRRINHREDSFCRANICPRLPLNRTKIDPQTGEQSHLVNVFMRHHDISFVVVPGSSLGRTIEKIANAVRVPAQRTLRRTKRGNVMSEKVALMLKQVPAVARKLVTDRGLSLREDVLRKLVRSDSDVISRMTKAGVILNPMEFQTAALHKMGHPGLARNLYNKKEVFQPSTSMQEYKGLTSAPDTGYKSTMPYDDAEIVSSRSLLGRFLQERPERHSPRIFVRAVYRRVPSNNMMLEKVSSYYNAYRINALEYLVKNIDSPLIITEEDLFLQKTASVTLEPMQLLPALYSAVAYGGETQSDVVLDGQGNVGKKLGSLICELGYRLLD